MENDKEIFKTRIKAEDKEKYYWMDHPGFPSTDWIYEVNNGDTRLGYWEWVNRKLEQNAMELFEMRINQ